MTASIPDRAFHAHPTIVPVLSFLTKYREWTSHPRDTDCDFALGNPQSMPLPGLVDALRDAVSPQRPDWFGYKMSEDGSREIVSRSLDALTGRSWAPEDVFMTNGATGALMVALNTLVERGDEVIYCSPPWFFYGGMISMCGGRPVSVPARGDGFDLDVEAIADAVTERTRVVIVNSPHNPTGKVYGAETLTKLSSVLSDASRRIGRRIYLLSDEAYRTIVFDGREFVSPTSFYRSSMMVYTYGKSLLAPGQRLGYLALSPDIDERAALREAVTSSQILCGWAVSSALMQHALARLQGLTVDVGALEARRDLLVRGLRESGYETHSPEGGFYVMTRTPIEDDDAFATALAERGVFCLPGRVVELPGYLRVSLTASDEMIERALPIFAELARRHRG